MYHSTGVKFFQDVKCLPGAQSVEDKIASLCHEVTVPAAVSVGQPLHQGDDEQGVESGPRPEPAGCSLLVPGCIKVVYVDPLGYLDRRLSV